MNEPRQEQAEQLQDAAADLKEAAEKVEEVATDMTLGEAFGRPDPVVPRDNPYEEVAPPSIDRDPEPEPGGGGGY